MFDILNFNWIPAENAYQRTLKYGIPFDVWINDGLLYSTDGDVTDFEAVKNKILDLPYGENDDKIIYYPDCSEQAIFNNISKKAPRLWRLTRNLHLTPARRRD